MSRFYFGSDSDSDSIDPESLPFPAPLSPSAFSAELDTTFSPTTFLATLHHRHHTLEDLRAELRARSKDLDKELVDLVNRDYVDFVGLGSSLSGGDRTAEDLKMGLWGFRRDVEGVVMRIAEVAEDVGRQLMLRKQIRKETILARTLLSLTQRIDELSSLLLLDGSTPAESASLLFEGNCGALGGEGLTGLPRLKRLVLSYRYTTQFLLPRVPKGHPFLEAQMARIKQVRSTLIFDLGSAFQESKLAGDVDKMIVVMSFYADLEVEGETVRGLKEAKNKS